jgi:hypothetical protein
VIGRIRIHHHPMRMLKIPIQMIDVYMTEVYFTIREYMETVWKIYGNI